MNPFSSRMSGNNWVLPVSALSLVIGFMVMAASITATTRSSRLGLLGPSQRMRVGAGPLDVQEELANASQEVTKLRAEKSKLEKVLGNNGSSSKVLNESLQDAKAFAGLTDLEGPGVKITLSDSRKNAPAGFAPLDVIIHDTDVLKVTNELFAAGSEAVDVNGHRLIATSFIRCVGPVMYVDGAPVASPVVIRAIGDGPAMMGGLNLPGGVLSEIRQTDPTMVQIEQVKNMRIASFSGSTTRKVAKVPSENR